jgi:hypothetical protein
MKSFDVLRGGLDWMKWHLIRGGTIPEMVEEFSG